MKRILLALALGAVAVSAYAADALKSGLKPGEKVGAFQVADVTGPAKGGQLCYRCKFGNSPVVAAFIKGDAKEAADVVGGLVKLTETHKELKSFVVFMGGQELQPTIEKIAAEKKSGNSVPLTILPGGPNAADIAAYQINPAASSTVMLWNRGTVHASFANPTKANWADVTKSAESMLK